MASSSSEDHAIELVRPVPGIRLGTAAAGIRYPERDDLLVMEIAEGASTAAVFTRNRFCAAPVTVAQRHLAAVRPRYLLINSGNANAGTGAQGVRDAVETCKQLAAIVDCPHERILPFSTGVIGEELPTDRFGDALPQALSSLSLDGWPAASKAIMTTDTVPKLASRAFEYQGTGITVTGMAKGSGMICPDMATMLAYVATDIAVDQELLQACLREAVEASFNAITVDGDTSTNDACVLVATGALGLPAVSDPHSEIYRLLSRCVQEVCLQLARAIVRDGEGASKLVEIDVEGARGEAEAREVAYTVAHSPLVKTALFASDPNWGRILAAVGRANVADLDITGVEIWLDEVCVVQGGGRAPHYTEAAGQTVMDRESFRIGVKLGRGDAQVRILTCDLSHEYVRINAEYRT